MVLYGLLLARSVNRKPYNTTFPPRLSSNENDLSIIDIIYPLFNHFQAHN